MKIIEFNGVRVEAYLDGVLQGFLRDPADTDYQKGYLAAIMDTYREGLRLGAGDDRLDLLDKQVRAE